MLNRLSNSARAKILAEMKSKGMTATVRSEIRAALAGILRDELARALTGMFGTRRVASRPI